MTTSRTVGDFTVTVRGEITAPNIATDCGYYPCEEHYVVRVDDVWVRAFHNEIEAEMFADDMVNLSTEGTS